MNNFDLLVPRQQPATDTWTWATVTLSEPLRIRLDGDTDPLPATPDSLVSGLKVGERVWVQLNGHRVIVHAPSGGGGSAVPIGVMQMWPTETPPVGYLICDGSAFDTNAYPDLYALLGTNVLPDLRQRFPRGGYYPNNAGATGGQETKYLSTYELPYHNHYNYHTHDMAHNHPSQYSEYGGDHSHTIFVEGSQDIQQNTGSAWRIADVGSSTAGGGANYWGNTDSGGGHVHYMNVAYHYGSTGGPSDSYTGYTGSGGGFSILNPYYTVNFIIKAE